MESLGLIRSQFVIKLLLREQTQTLGHFQLHRHGQMIGDRVIDDLCVVDDQAGCGENVVERACGFPAGECVAAEVRRAQLCGAQ